MKKWYARNRKYKLGEMAAYRKGHKELFDWHHDKQRFGGLKAEVLKRDLFSCQVCGTKKKSYLVVHHKDVDRSNNTMDNLITLCKSCHPRIHRILGWYKKDRNKMKIQSALTGDR